ncbi:MAG: VanW family protein [Anaerolineae bacterium]
MLNQLTQAIKIAPPKRIALWIPLAFVAISGGVLVLMLFAVLGYQIVFLNRAYPGTQVAGAPVGGMTRAELMAAVETLAQAQLNRTITITADDQSWTFSGQQLGMRVDAAATADRVFDIGRRGNLLADMATQFTLLRSPQSIEPIIRYDSGPTNEVLGQLSQTVDYPPQNAGLTITPEGVVEVTISQRGRRLHLDSIRPQIEAAIFGDGPQTITAITQQVLPAIDMEDLSAVQQQARSLLGQPFTFRLAEPDGAVNQWRLQPAQLGPMLQVVEEVDAAGKPLVRLALNSQQLMPYMAQLTQTINLTAENASLFFNDETGQLEATRPSRDGRQLDVAAALALAEQAVAAGSSSVELPVTPIPAKISSERLEELGITALVSEQTSYFKGSSQGRMTNIALAASKFNGVVVPPGEIFSFNDNLGPITAEQGYDESLIIFGDRTILDVGGGVCQVSTTAFRAALFGGFELVERWAHGYRVGWYETNSVPGLDATIYTPDVDMRFRNDTDHFLLIQTETDLDEGTVTFKFYGTPTSREVTVDEPVISNITQPPPPAYEADPTLPPGTVKQIDWAKDGMEVAITRVVKVGDTVLHRDEIVSRYRPWQAVFQVSPDALPRQPAPQGAAPPGSQRRSQ